MPGLLPGPVPKPSECSFLQSTVLQRIDKREGGLTIVEASLLLMLIPIGSSRQSANQNHDEERSQGSHGGIRYTTIQFRPQRIYGFEGFSITLEGLRAAPSGRSSDIPSLNLGNSRCRGS